MPIKTNQFIAIILRKSFNFLEDKEQLKKDKENTEEFSKELYSLFNETYNSL